MVFASRSNRCLRAASEENCAGKILIATVRPRRVSRARYTSPIPPAPSGETISYGPRIAPRVRATVVKLYLPKQNVGDNSCLYRFVACRLLSSPDSTLRSKILSSPKFWIPLACRWSINARVSSRRLPPAEIAWGSIDPNFVPDLTICQQKTPPLFIFQLSTLGKPRGKRGRAARQPLRSR